MKTIILPLIIIFLTQCDKSHTSEVLTAIQLLEYQADTTIIDSRDVNLIEIYKQLTMSCNENGNDVIINHINIDFISIESDLNESVSPISISFGPYICNNIAGSISFPESIIFYADSVIGGQTEKKIISYIQNQSVYSELAIIDIICDTTTNLFVYENKVKNLLTICLKGVNDYCNFTYDKDFSHLNINEKNIVKSRYKIALRLLAAPGEEFL